MVGARRVLQVVPCRNATTECGAFLRGGVVFDTVKLSCTDIIYISKCLNEL